MQAQAGFYIFYITGRNNLDPSLDVYNACSMEEMVWDFFHKIGTKFQKL